MTAPQRAADRLLNRLTQPAAGDRPNTRCVTAEVVAVDVGASEDGVALITVKWSGGQDYASYVDSYTPVVGHVVDCGYNGAALHIHGRLIGIPPEV